MNPKIFPTILIVLDVAAAVVYASHRDWRHAIYWLAAAVLTTCVTFLGNHESWMRNLSKNRNRKFLYSLRRESVS